MGYRYTPLPSRIFYHTKFFSDLPESELPQIKSLHKSKNIRTFPDQFKKKYYDVIHLKTNDIIYLTEEKVVACCLILNKV